MRRKSVPSKTVLALQDAYRLVQRHARYYHALIIHSRLEDLTPLRARYDVSEAEKRRRRYHGLPNLRLLETSPVVVLANPDQREDLADELAYLKAELGLVVDVVDLRREAVTVGRVYELLAPEGRCRVRPTPAAIERELARIGTVEGPAKEAGKTLSNFLWEAKKRWYFVDHVAELKRLEAAAHERLVRIEAAERGMPVAAIRARVTLTQPSKAGRGRAWRWEWGKSRGLQEGPGSPTIESETGATSARPRPAARGAKRTSSKARARGPKPAPTPIVMLPETPQRNRAGRRITRTLGQLWTKGYEAALEPGPLAPSDERGRLRAELGRLGVGQTAPAAALVADLRERPHRRASALKRFQHRFSRGELERFLRALRSAAHQFERDCTALRRLAEDGTPLPDSVVRIECERQNNNKAA